MLTNTTSENCLFNVQKTHWWKRTKADTDFTKLEVPTSQVNPLSDFVGGIEDL